MATVDRGRIERATRELLLAIGEDPGRPGLEETPARVAAAFAEYLGGVGEDPLELLADAIPLAEDDAGEAVVMRDIAFRSFCEHHLLPFIGVAHVAYVPRQRVIGLGRIPRVVEVVAARPQVQERLGEQIADALERGLDAAGVLVVLEASHGCVTMRGPRQESSTTVTIASRGELSDRAARAEIMALLGSGRP